MSQRRSFGLFVSSLSLVLGCGGAPSPAPLRPAANAAPAPQTSATVAQKDDSSALSVTNSAASACAATRASTLRPVQSGRGERVVLAKREQSTLAFVANEDDGSIHSIDLDKRDEIAVTQLPGSPSAMLLLADGRLVVALRDRNELLVMESDAENGSKFETRCRLVTPSEPVGLASAMTNGGEKIAVTAGYGHALGIFEAQSFATAKWINLARDPRAVLIAHNRAFVSHTVSADVSMVDLDSGKVETINVFSNKRIRSLNAPNSGDPLLGSQAFALAKNENGRLWAPMVMVDPGEAKITSAYGSAEIPVKAVVGVVDMIAGKELQLPLIASEARTRECFLPRAADAVGDRLFVLCLGSDELMELDGRGQNATSFMRRRVQVARGPLGLAVNGRQAVVMSQFDRVVNIIDIDDEKAAPVMIALSRPEGPIDEAFERGRQIFHDGFEGRVSKDGRACANCHPDGREDGFTWSTPDGPRQTISLAGRIPNAAPYGWFGDHADIRNHLKHTVTRLGGQGFDTKDQADLDALVTYISRMKSPVAGPNPANADLVAKGHALFHASAQGCGECHAEGGTDRQRHDIGTGRDVEARLSFDTPSLMSIAGSAPYFHDGRYKSLDELMSKADDKMGHAKHLKPEDRAAMIAYMESISPALAPEREARKFVRPNKPVVLPSIVNSPFEQLIARQSPARNAVSPIELDVNSLPIVQIEPMIKYNDKNPEPQGGELKKLLVWNGECASVPYHSAAYLNLDWRSTGMTRALEHCVGTPDADGVRVWRDLTVHAIDPLPDGRLHVERFLGYFRVGTHETHVTQTTIADAVPFANGLFFAFRTNCPKCSEGMREELIVITPPTPRFGGEDFYDWRTLRLDAGKADDVEAIFDHPNLERWKKATKVAVQTGSTVGSPKGVVFRIATSRLFSADKPSVAAGRSTCIQEEFGCR